MRLIGSIFLLVWLSACGGGSSSDNEQVPPPVSSNDGWSIDTDFVRDGGPGKDGIPALDFPIYLSIANATFISDFELVIGTNINGIARAFPHSILNWHEIVNLQTGSDYHTLSYCPLTGTAALWTIPEIFSNKTFGVSGLLYNSNLILYDRETDSNWPQMLAESANGSLIGTLVEENVVIETTWGSWKQMYPGTSILSDDTGFSRDYSDYPYGSYLTSGNLLFQVAHEDARLHKKTRVLGISKNGINKVYEIENFSAGIDVINQNAGSSPYVVIGSSGFDFAIAYSSTLSDGTELIFTAIESSLPIVMQDNEGNQWNILGTAISGSREGQKLALESDFIAFWFAWVAFHPNPEIHNFN